MNHFSENRYKLLFIDDEADESNVGQEMQGQVNAGKQKSKRGKTPRDDKAKTIEMIKSLNQSMALTKLNLKLDALNVGGGSKAKEQQLKMQQQMRQQLQQQLQKQLRQEEQKKLRQEEQKKQKQLRQEEQKKQQQGQQQNPGKDRTYRERIVNNSNRGFNGAKGGFAGGRGYASAGLARASGNNNLGNGNVPNGFGSRALIKSKLDRHSSSDKTGIKPVVKRNGGGAHNWGSALKDIEDQNLAMKRTPSDITDGTELQKQDNGINPPDDVDNTKYITVEQWRAMHAVRAKPVYNIRKPGEGEPNRPDWKKMTVLQKKKEQQLDDNGYEYDPSMYPQRVGRLQRVVDIEFKFNDDRRRSGYLSNWSSRNRKKTGGEDTTAAINMNDEAEFPTLG